MCCVLHLNKCKSVQYLRIPDLHHSYEFVHDWIIGSRVSPAHLGHLLFMPPLNMLYLPFLLRYISSARLSNDIYLIYYQILTCASRASLQRGSHKQHFSSQNSFSGEISPKQNHSSSRETHNVYSFARSFVHSFIHLSIDRSS